LHRAGTIDPGRVIDWGRTAEDYAQHRAGPPASFFQRLLDLGVGLPGQRILDLATGTGALARSFAAQGCRVTGTDIAAGQIDMARRLADAQGLQVDFRVAAAEQVVFPAASFDVATANQCWLYFDDARTLQALRAQLVPRGLLVIGHFSWLPREDPIARASEELVLQFNPAWRGADWSGAVPELPGWPDQGVRVRSRFVYDEPVGFTRDGWRGRMRACRGVGATLTAAEVADFDQAHAQLLDRIAPARFFIPHRIDAHLFELA
jgi:SAM-dependent methyltransferase